jgi:hypothetical protein
MKDQDQPQRIIGGLRLPPDLFDRLDLYCSSNKLKPSRTRVVEVALREFLDREFPAETQPEPRAIGAVGSRR